MGVKSLAKRCWRVSHTDNTEDTEGAYLGSVGDLNEHEFFECEYRLLILKHKPDKHLIVF